MYKKYRCPCCEFKTLNSDSAYFDICPICYWENDNIQRDNPNYAGGANNISLNEARQNYREIGTISSKYLDRVRPPLEEENK